MLTSAIEELIQRDASLQKMSPYVHEKWTLITSRDNYRWMLYADLIETEISWARIQVIRSLMQEFGVPHHDYVDNLRIFLFVQQRDSVWTKKTCATHG